MKIEKLKINAYGNLNKKEIELNNKINIIQGNNESGKSTLLKFIVNIFYGTSKNKKGKEFSDYDRYKPWDSEEFSGKLTYKLDNGKKYEVYRDFNKKDPIIYNEDLEDISKEFTIDKTYGNQFFIEQTGLDEEMFLSTLVSMQQEVKIDKNVQNVMVQKVANLAGTGDDNISYKKAIEKINKKQIEEIGTTRTQGRPINIVKEEKFKLQDEIGELEEYRKRKKEIEIKINENKEELEKINKTLDEIKKLKYVQENNEIEEQKIKVEEEIKEKQIERKNELEEEKEKILGQVKENKIRKVNLLPIILLVLSVILEILNIILIKNNIVMIVFILGIISSISLLIFQNRSKQEKYKEKKTKLEEIEAQIKVLENSILEQEKQIQTKRFEIKQKVGLENNEEEKILNVKNELEKIEEEKNKIILEIRSLELEENTINPKLEKIALLEEELDDLNKKEEDLNKENEAIELAKEILEKSYKEMKQNVTPKLTNELSENLKKISNSKYSKVSLSEEKGLIIEKENGEYIDIEKLSIGTIDQLYLSLRLAIARNLCNEKVPIILDEAFAYYDDERLENILKYLLQEENQIIIFTCTNREKNILEKLKVEFNLISL